MRTAVSRLVPALCVLGIVLSSSCATTPEGGGNTPAGGAAAGGSVLSVENNHTSFNAITIFLEPEAGGARQSMGVIEVGQTRTFPLPLQRGWYVLLAQHSGGEVRSQRFHVPTASTVSWDLRLNRVRVVPR